MMFRLATSLAMLVVLAGSGVAVGDIISWHASSGVLPDDSSISPEHRFQIALERSFVSMQAGFLNVNDTVRADQVKIFKDDIDSIRAGDSWAYEIELRMNSHDRSYLDWGAELGITDQSRSGILCIARDKVGFQGYSGNSFINNSSFAMDTVNDFHTFRVVKDSSTVSLYVDTFDVPVLTVGYDDLEASTSTRVYMTGSSSYGTANFDVRSFIANTSGTAIRGPSILEFFDASVEEGRLQGTGAGFEAIVRLFIMRFMLEQADEAVQNENALLAFWWLVLAYGSCDGLPWPMADLVTGEAAPELASMILDFILSELF